MTEVRKDGVTRRDLLSATGKIAAASALTGVAIPAVHAGENNTINVALVGCGGRGTGAAVDAMNTNKIGPIQIVAMADVFKDRLDKSHDTLKKEVSKQLAVTDDKKFIGFDAYMKAMDCLKPHDVVILTTPPAFRWVQFKYAIQKGLNVFMEKPVTVDGPTSKRMFALGEEAKKKNLKVAVGLMCRHCRVRKELYDRIRQGQIGEITLLRAYRMLGPTASAFAYRAPKGTSELLHQIREFHAFLWLSGGAYSDFLIHNIDECCWMKDAFPVEAKSSGGRHYRGDYIDQNFDTYSTEFTFADGTKMFLEGRTMTGCHQEFASYAHGTKAAAVISQSAHSPARCKIYKNQIMKSDNIAWQWKPKSGPYKEPNPYKLEWEDLIEAIRNDKPYSEVERGVKASLVTSMGRMAAHTGRVITYDQILNSNHEFAPDIDKLTLTSPSPLQAGSDGRYPIPMPGVKTTREY